MNSTGSRYAGGVHTEWCWCIELYRSTSAVSPYTAHIATDMYIYTGWIIKNVPIFCLSKYTCSKPGQNWIEQLDRALSALYLLITPVMSLKTSLRNTGWRRHTPKINLSKSDISPERLTIQGPVSRKSWRWASEFLGVEKLMSFSLIHRKQKLTRTVTLICWRLPYCLNVVDIIRAMTSNFCKWRDSFYDRTLQSS